MGRYHINFEGKIYPCKAKVYKCPYGEEFHSENKAELYYKLIGTHGTDTSPSDTAMSELKRTGRVKSLFSTSEEVAKVDYPVDIIVASLKETLIHLEDPKTKQEIEDMKKLEKITVEDIRIAYLNGITDFPSYLPKSLVERGRREFIKKDGGKVLEEGLKGETLRRQSVTMGRLYDRRDKYKDFIKREESGLNHHNYESTYAWVVRDFERFSHDLNTSKMITQPIFYGSVEKSKEAIKNMDNYELLAIYDDYSVTDKEIERNVKEANYFQYTWRNDLTEAANKSMETWYNRNREIYENWKINTPKRVLLSMEIAKELDRRGVLRQDSAIEELLSEIK